MSIQSNVNKGIALTLGATAAKEAKMEKLQSNTLKGEKRLSDIAINKAMIKTNPNYDDTIRAQSLQALEQEENSLKSIIDGYKTLMSKYGGDE